MIVQLLVGLFGLYGLFLIANSRSGATIAPTDLAAEIDRLIRGEIAVCESRDDRRRIRPDMGWRVV
jgi:hypothetical protein